MSATAAVPKLLPLALKQTPEICGEIYQPRYAQVTDIARQWAVDNKIKPAATDKTKVGVLMIDVQVDFCVGPDPLADLANDLSKHVPANLQEAFKSRFGASGIPRGSLYVRGAEQDTSRLCNFIQSNADVITTLVATLDTHKTVQIFYESFLVAGTEYTDPITGVQYSVGDHPKPYTSISLAQIKDGTWELSPSAAHATTGDPSKHMALTQHLLHYCETLEKAGKYSLFIWPYHTMLGSPGHALVPALAEVCHLHDIARGSQTQHAIKGGNPLTENYSPFCPEVTSSGGVQIAQRETRYLDLLLSHDYVVIAGQAKSHCVKWAIDDMLEYILKQDANLAKKVYLMEDATSPVVIVPGQKGLDFTQEADEAFDRFKAAGMHIIKSTDNLRQLFNL